MAMRCPKKGLLASAVLIAPAAASAGETVTYTYDALGRLVATSTSGGPNNLLSVATGYDPAGNRCQYNVSTTGGATAAPCGGGGVGNQPPVAVNDSGTMTRCLAKTFAVLANDSDPDGNLPLALVSVSYDGLRGTASISGTSILFEPNDIIGSATVTYVMRDSLSATDSASLTITSSYSSGRYGNNAPGADDLDVMRNSGIAVQTIGPDVTTTAFRRDWQDFLIIDSGDRSRLPNIPGVTVIEEEPE